MSIVQSMKCVFYETEPWEQQFFSEKLQNIESVYFPNPLTSQTVDPETDILSTFIYSHCTADILQNLPRLKLIVTRSTGTDHIDMDYCKSHNILVKNVPSYGIDTIAEHTFAMILMLTRNMLSSVERTRKGSFDLTGLRGPSLAGKTIGIVGTGAIGTRVIELANAFKMKILAYARHPQQTLIESYHVQFTDIDTILKNSDIVSLHLPAVPETFHLIHKENILHMKKGSLLINTARGALVDTEAIVLALEQGILKGVGLDVLEEEKALKEERELVTKQYTETNTVKIQLLNHVLLNRDDVIITPHNAFNSPEALQEILEKTLDNIVSFMNIY